MINRLPLLTLLLVWGATFACAGQMTLEEAIAIALESNLGVRQSRKDLDVAGSTRERAHADRYLPTLEIALGAESSASPLTVFDTTGARYLLDEESTSGDGSILLRQPLPFDATLGFQGAATHRRREQQGTALPTEVDGEIEATLTIPLLDRSGSAVDADEIAARDLEKAQIAHEAAVGDLTLSVVRSYYGLTRAQGLLDIRTRSYEASRSQAARAREKFRAGLIAEGDLLQLEVARDLGEASLVTAKGSVASARESLNDLLGRLPGAATNIDSEVPPPPVIELDEATLLNRALERREEIARARIATENARLSVDTAGSAQGVNGRIELGAGLRGDGSNLRSTIENRQRNRSARVTLDWALWDWGRGRRRVDEARAAVERSTLAEEDARRSVRLDLRARLRAYDEALSRASVLKRAELAATRAYEIAVSRFEAGNIDSQRLLQEQQSLQRAESDRLNAVIDVHLTLAEMERAVMGPLKSPDANQ